MRVRAYEPADAVALSRLIQSTLLTSNAADYEPEKLQPFVDSYSPARVDELNRGRACFVADDDGRIVGTAALEGDQLVTFFVAPDQHRRGIGRALLQRIEDTAATRGLHALTVHASDVGAPFYEALGFARTGRIVELSAGPHIEMHKQLTRAASSRSPFFAS